MVAFYVVVAEGGALVCWLYRKFFGSLGQRPQRRADVYAVFVAGPILGAAAVFGFLRAGFPIAATAQGLLTACLVAIIVFGKRRSGRNARAGR